MPSGKTLVLSLAVLTGVVAQADAAGTRASWRWTTWSRNRGVTVSEPTPAPTPEPPSLAPAAPVAPAPAAPVTTVAPSYWLPANRWSSVAQVQSNPTTVAASNPGSSYSAPAPAAPSFAADAFVNLTDGGFLQSGSLTTGNAMPWWDSPAVSKVFGGLPDSAQRADFSNTILQRVEQTFQNSGVPVTLTTDPNVSAAHTLSVVSNTSFASNPDAIGITDVGNNGFSFIDKLGYSNSVDELEWAVAHNVTHELMHAFGVDHRDTTGQFLDSGITPWNVLVSPTSTLSTAAAQDLLARDLKQRGGSAALYSTGAQMLDHPKTCTCPNCQGQHILFPSPVPEPTTLILWGLVGVGAMVAHGRRTVR